VRLLLDTHALLWWQTDDPQLSASARAAIIDETNEVFVSAASAWEIATKVRLGKLLGLEDAASRFGVLVDADGFRPLAISQDHALRAGSYDVPHRDPFDRVLAAQSELERLVLVTRDPDFALFSTSTLW
jgi:PIN domain nuclease of toxin-antitoxin system